MRDQDLNERPGEAPPQSKLENPGETKTKQKRSPSTHRVEPRKVVLIRVRSSMRDQDLNERPGEAPPQSKLERPIYRELHCDSSSTGNCIVIPLHCTPL